MNPEHPFVAHICQNITEQELESMPELDLKKNPIKKAQISSGSIQDIVNFFRPLRCDKSLPDIQSITTKLTEDYISKLRRKLKVTTRTAKVQQALFETMKNPDEQIVSALIKASSALSHINAKPSEILSIWSTGYFLQETMQNRK